MKRSGFKPRNKGLRARSTKMAALYAGDGEHEGRAAFVARMLADRPACEAGIRIGDHIGESMVVMPRWARCDINAVDVHELLPRSAGGSITEEDNVITVCRACHHWIHENSKVSRELGLLKSRYQPRPTDVRNQEDSMSVTLQKPSLPMSSEAAAQVELMQLTRERDLLRKTLQHVDAQLANAGWSGDHGLRAEVTQALKLSGDTQ